jgi:hypothetical protein
MTMTEPGKTGISDNTTGHYADMVAFLIAHADTPVNVRDYFLWTHRDLSLQWGTGQQADEKVWQGRIAQLAYTLANAAAGGRTSAVNRMGEPLNKLGALYRTGESYRSGLWVLDTSANWKRRPGNKVVLFGNVLPHVPDNKTKAVLYTKHAGISEGLVNARQQEQERMKGLITEARSTAQRERDDLLAEEQRQAEAGLNRLPRCPQCDSTDRAYLLGPCSDAAHWGDTPNDWHTTVALNGQLIAGEVAAAAQQRAAKNRAKLQRIADETAARLEREAVERQAMAEAIEAEAVPVVTPAEIHDRGITAAVAAASPTEVLAMDKDKGGTVVIRHDGYIVVAKVESVVLL